jgi:hypothetical protein
MHILTLKMRRLIPKSLSNLLSFRQVVDRLAAIPDYDLKDEAIEFMEDYYNKHPDLFTTDRFLIDPWRVVVDWDKYQNFYISDITYDLRPEIDVTDDAADKINADGWVFDEDICTAIGIDGNEEQTIVLACAIAKLSRFGYMFR